MSGAIAYNVFFSLIPLAFATVAALSMVSIGTDVIDWIEGLVIEGVPPEAGDFIVSTVNDAQAEVGGLGPAVLVVSLLVALWSGSRAIYALQKALRLIEGVSERRVYWKTRGFGILLTAGAGVALVVAYIVLLFGGWVMEILNKMGVDVLPVTITSIVVVAVWAGAVLFAIYQWGNVVPAPRPFISAAVVAVLLTLATWFGALLVPPFGRGTAAAIADVGVLLVWAYVVGFVTIVTPSVVAAVEMVIRGPNP
jgi:membrane protein